MSSGKVPRGRGGGLTLVDDMLLRTRRVDDNLRFLIPEANANLSSSQTLLVTVCSKAEATVVLARKHLPEQRNLRILRQKKGAIDFGVLPSCRS